MLGEINLLRHRESNPKRQSRVSIWDQGCSVDSDLAYTDKANSSNWTHIDGTGKDTHDSKYSVKDAVRSV